MALKRNVSRCLLYPRVTNLQTNLVVAVYQTVGGAPKPIGVTKVVTTLTSHVEMKSQGIMMEVVTTKVEYFVLGPIVEVMVQTIQIQLRHAT